MPKITLKIINQTNADYPEILLRKYFNMVFISENGKKITIYTATVFGGLKEKWDSSQSVIKPSYLKDKECKLKFEYSTDCQADIKYENLTSDFLSQVDWIKRIWGSAEKQKTQKETQKKMKELYNIEYAQNLEGLIYIEEPNKEFHKFIVQEGDYEIGGSDDGYKLVSKDLSDGIEYINWVRTRITLSESVLKKNLEYEISFCGGTYYAPDFTWYISTTGGYRVDAESTNLKVSNKDIANPVQYVNNVTTVRFEEWVNQEYIDDCQKSRFLINQNVTDKPLKFFESEQNDSIFVRFKVNNPHESGNRQFFIGILIAFILTFCADKTRMNDFYECIHRFCKCGQSCTCKEFCNLLSIIFPISALLTFISIIFNLKKCIPSQKKKTLIGFRIIKLMGIISAVLAILYAFGIWMIAPSKIGILVDCYINKIVLCITLGISILCDIIWVFWCTVIRGKKIIDFL